jgi:TP901 family phage tail tape measure protein
MAGKVGVAFGVSADLAGESFIKTQNALGGTIEQTEKLMDTINFLGNTTAASSANLLTFMASGGSGVARAVGDSGQAVAAMGAQLIAMGKSAEESATILERFTKNTLKTDSLRAVFDNAGGGAAGMLAVIEKGTKLAAKEQDAYFQQFGEYGISLQLLGKNFDSLSKNVQAATNEQLINNSVLDEFANRSNTTAFKLAQMRTQVQNVAVKVGSALLPIIVKLTDKITPIIMRITDWISRNRELVEMIVKFVAILGALSFAISGVAFIIGVYSKAVLIVNTITKAWAAAQTILNLILIANPIGIVIALVGLLAAAIAWVVLHTEGWGETWGSVMDFMENYIKMWYYTVESIFLGIEHSFLTMVDNIVLAWKWGQNAIGLLSDEQYAKDKARIEAEKKARISALQESIAARTAATGEVMKGIDWQVKWKGEDAPAINQPKSDMDSQTEKIISGQMKSSVDLNLNDPRLSVANVSPNVNVRTSSTK